ncbi:MAG: hypothetical protein F6J99_42090 [Moorea sp. SIO4G3]|nr:hypothetical protein [Moorena sp. SIO4G3]
MDRLSATLRCIKTGNQPQIRLQAHYPLRCKTWVLIRLLPPMPPVVFARFRNYSDAKGYSQTLKQLVPDAKFLIVLDRSLFCQTGVKP